MDLPHRHLRLRTRFHHLRPRRQFPHVDRRPRHCRSRRIGSVFRGDDYHRLLGPPSTPCDIHSPVIQHVWHLFRHRTHPRRGVYGSRDVAMVFLDQPAHRCHRHPDRLHLLQEPEA